jgi:hypothetical protein
MGLAMRLATLFCLTSMLSLAGSWTGVLVDSTCYDDEERNVNPFDGSTDVNHDRDLEIRFCRPKARTKLFAVVQQSGVSFKLDPAGNAKAAEIVRNAAKKSRLVVAVTGEMSNHTVKVDSIALLR